MMQEKSVAAIGWSKIGDLSIELPNDTFKETVRQRIAENHPATPQVVGRATQQVANFCKAVAERDLIIACDGNKVLGIGRVTGPYVFDPSGGFPHQRPVEWLDTSEWQLPESEGLQTAVHELRKHANNLVAIEMRVLEGNSPPMLPRRSLDSALPMVGTKPPMPWTAGGTIGRIQDVLNRKGQLILYGPPGTGKTFWAEQATRQLAALWNFGVPFERLNDSDRAQVFGSQPSTFVQFCCFHPGYGYEDFIEGFRPGLADGALHFERQNGLFKNLCDTAAQNPDKRYYLIVDEINRGDIPRIFGELITLLDKPKRGTGVRLPLSGHTLSVPANVFVVGTMNTADRSIALLDTALRRRFGFIELLPDPQVFGGAVIDGIPLGPWLAEVNGLISTHVGRDGRNLQIGHSYFLSGGRPLQGFAHLARVIQEDILPLLEEYCYDEWSILERILGQGLVDVAGRRFKHEIFETNRRSELLQAILAAAPNLGSSSIAIAADAAALSADTIDDTDDEDS